MVRIEDILKQFINLNVLEGRESVKKELQAAIRVEKEKLYWYEVLLEAIEEK